MRRSHPGIPIPNTGNALSPDFSLVISEQRQSELRALVGSMIRNGLKAELNLLASAASLQREAPLGPEQLAELEYVAQQLRDAMERALNEPTGDLRLGASRPTP